ncbi:hypothetical protein F5Y08DRAFT_316274 [Xylaria arbuscula]|nr:hypothetical protein F5Y08DRAFT_316274 [Xylaria arbuscula]
MADPLSVAGLATGAISLGLQVAGGLSDYLDAVKGRSEDLKSAKEGATEMRDLLLTIQDLLPRIESNWPAPATIVKRHITSCRVELGALQALLSELSQPSLHISGLRSRLDDTKNKLFYPFERPKIRRLEERISKVNDTLRTALQVTDLDVSVTTASGIRDLQAVSTTTANQINQIHDLVVSLSQSQISLRTQSVAASLSPSAAQETPEAGKLLTLYSVETAKSLASKPSLLSTSIKASDALQPYIRNLTQICICRSSRKVVTRRRNWGNISFSYETSNKKRHLPCCPLSQIDNETQTSKFTIEYFGLKKLFQTALAFSLLNIRGAGGRSISPGFTYYPTVDEKAAPAFRVVELAMGFIFCNNFWDETAITTLQCCYDTIFELYRKRKASPKDMTAKGQSIMQSIEQLVRYGFVYRDTSILDLTMEMVTNLVAYGVPMDTYNTVGLTPAVSVVSELMAIYDIINPPVSLVKRLLPQSDIPLMIPRSGVGFSYTFENMFLDMVLEDPELAEASGCGPLSLAARAGDEESIQKIIQRHPESLREINDFGHTPLRLALRHPPCLRLILENMKNCWDQCWDGRPLEDACRLGYRASTQTLLAADSPITDRCIRDSHVSCVNDVLVALKKRRDELKSLALAYLTQTEARSFELYEDKVLDGHAQGVYIPLCLCDLPPTPVYCIGCSVSTLDKLWALGFRDVNSPDDVEFDEDSFDALGHGDVPLTSNAEHDVEKLQWLIEHGADYWTPFSERKSNTNAVAITATPAHFLFGKLGQRLSQKYCGSGPFSDDPTYGRPLEICQWLVEKLMQVQASDACDCSCSGGGCTPLKGLFDWIPNNYAGLGGLALWCVGITQYFQASFNTQDLIAILRRVTFDGLELAHTCCDFRYYLEFYYKSLHTPDEVDEINSDQRPLLTLFNDLLVEFTEVALEARKRMPLISHDPMEFWIGRWLPRMEETLGHLNGDDLTTHERLAAEAVGVVWRPQPVRKVEVNWRGLWTSKNVMRELKKILDE